MFNKLKQIKDLRDKAKKVQAALSEETVQCDHKGIVIKMDGNQKIHGIQIDDNLMRDKTKLEVSLTDAFNKSIEKVQKVMVKKMQSMGDLNIPGLS